MSEWIGILTDGEPCSLNGKPFSLDINQPDMASLFAVNDVIGYPTGREFMITVVEPDLVKMVGPIFRKSSARGRRESIA